MRARIGLVAMSVLLAACGAQSSASPSASTVGNASQPASQAEASAAPFADAWEDVTESAIGTTAEYTNRVELADINADGVVDLLFANGGNYDAPGTPVASWAFAGNGDGTFTDVSRDVFGDMVDLVRVIKVRDVNADGMVDIVLGTVYHRQSRLLLGATDGSFTDVTATNLPEAALSVGDLEIGDVDDDGDLDIVLADWGDGNPFDVEGPVMLWLNDGDGVFSDASADQMPDTVVGFSWDLELIDVDNDWDLDVATSCKVCDGSLLYENDGGGTFTDVTERMPAYPNNYEFEPIDLDNDGFLDLLTINDGEPSSVGLREHVFRNEDGTFVDFTDRWWPEDANPGWDDAVVAPFDVESDGDADFIVASLDGPDRLLLNDGSGALSLVTGILDTSPSHGSLDWAIADFNGDGRPDMVESQGEVPGHHDERVYLATEAGVRPDTAAPAIRTNLGNIPGGELVVRARVHDHRSPNRPHDWQLVEVRWDGADPVAMTWYGEHLFRATINVPAGVTGLVVCARDAAGNEACSG